MEKEITFVIGGCRSGKSAWALDQADKIKGTNKYFVATSVPLDDEMQERVDTHQKERGPDWQTIEEPVKIHEIIRNYSEKADVILVDCLTLWVSYLMLQALDAQQIKKQVTTLETALNQSSCPVFLVSNEVGLGIVPDNSLARQFRDLAGFVNQRMAATAHRVTMSVAGIAVKIK